MRILPIVMLLTAGLITQPVWADHHDQRREEHRDDRRDDRREAPRFMPQQRQFQRDPREFQQRDPREFQRDPREYQQFQRPPQANFAPRNDFSPGDAARRAQEMNGGGRILAVDPNGPGYRVKVLKEGEVRVIAVPGG